MIYGLYKSRSASHYDDYGSDDSSHLMGVSASEQDLVDRWNAYVQKQRDDYDHSYPKRTIPPLGQYPNHMEPFIEPGKLTASWSGSTGGGYSSVSYSLRIKPVEQKI